MEEKPHWRPTIIDVEAEFTRFVPTFRNGQIIRDPMPDQPTMTLNADFCFSEDRVIVELKCMETDSRSGYSERLSRAFTHFGYTGSEIMGFLFRDEPMPAPVAARLQQQIANPLRQALRKANKQIAATKHHLKMPDAFGLAVFANDKNFGLTPKSALSILSRAALGLSQCHIDGFVYTTPNVYHDTGENIAQSIWIPLYAEGRESLADFVNSLGTAWFDYTEKLGEPYLERWKGDDYRTDILSAKPIETF